MATNISTLKALERMTELTDELNAWNTAILKKHIVAQKIQGGSFPKDRYSYNKDTKKVTRIKA